MKSGERMPSAWAPISHSCSLECLSSNKGRSPCFSRQGNSWIQTARSLVCPMGEKIPALERYPIPNTPTPSWESVSHGAGGCEEDQAEEQFLSEAAELPGLPKANSQHSQDTLLSNV